MIRLAGGGASVPPHTAMRLPDHNLARVRHSRTRGFTLVELLAVVAMIGVLSALAVVGFKKYMNSTRTADARSLIGAIRIRRVMSQDELHWHLHAR